MSAKTPHWTSKEWTSWNIEEEEWERGEGQPCLWHPHLPSSFRENCLSLLHPASHPHSPIPSGLLKQRRQTCLTQAQTLCRTKGFRAPFNQQTGQATGEPGNEGVGIAVHLEADLAWSECGFTTITAPGTSEQLGKGPWGRCGGGCTMPATCMCLCFLL